MDTPAPATSTTPLSATDLAVLHFESRWWTYPGSKDAAIREHLAMTSVRYYQLLTVLIDRPAALSHDPLLVRRLRRLRARRTTQRAARRTRDLG